MADISFQNEQQVDTVGAKRSLPAVSDVDEKASMPRKRFFRTRAHCNPLSHNDGFEYPVSPSEIDWTIYYPKIPETERVVRILDIGMGFGGLTVSLATLFPDKLVMGMEIRAKVCEYVRRRIEALRDEHPGQYNNASCLRTNCMRYLPNFFKKQQIEKIFICFPDPHFKAKNHQRRIVSHPLLSEYAYIMKPGGRLYVVTDVEELHLWHVAKCDGHPAFRRIPDEDAEKENPAVHARMLESTEESKKVARLGGNKHFAVYERLPDWDSSISTTATATATAARGDSSGDADNSQSSDKFASRILQLWD